MTRRFSLREAIASIAVGGLIVGCLDMAYAIAVYSPHDPAVIPENIASGILGKAAFAGGTQTIILGVVSHFFIATCVTAVYYFASLKFEPLIRSAVVSGLLYGLLVYLVMHGLVLPLSNVPHGGIPAIYIVTEFIEHAFLVGLPAALVVRYFARRFAHANA